MTEILKTIDLKKSYKESNGKLEVLRGVNLKINAAELVAITGQSGSGKSTLLHLLGMLDNADSGKIFYYGKEKLMTAKNINEFRNQNVGFVFQFHYLLEDFTAEENVAMPMFLATKNFSKSIKAARELLKSLDILDRKEHYPNQLSGGEQQRVAVARALINKPDIVYADEPTGNLDARHSEELVELIINLNKEHGQTFVLVTHDNSIAGKMTKHFHLENGVFV
ncbi:MAG: lipoprotein-releasing system ATP-binding protein LolD [Candidatus Cloacimonadota bacterium]|nr:MAG: lipoprotein-releasing system ATP-binding protein LolD [Candidatus Cloacimonadota bacterium]RLC51612.1 MAG: lipoprotein-releasing system ATP-binding protein LolD [Candidatus Cloacimonadota bacterium]